MSLDYRLIANSTQDWEFWLAPDGHFLYSSPSSLWTAGHPPEAFLADPDLLAAIIHPDDKAAYAHHQHGAIQTQEPGRIEFRIIRPDGSEVWIEHLCRPVHDADGRYLGARGSNRDITDRKRMEEALRRSDSHCRELFSHLADGVAVYGTRNNGEDFYFVDINPAGERLTRLQRDHLVGRSVLEVFPGIRDLGLLEAFQRVWRTAEPEHLPVAYYSDERFAEWFENHVFKLPSGEIVAVFRDISDHHILDETLRFLIQCGSPGTGEPFFPALARYLAGRLGMDYICIDRLEGGNLSARTVAVWLDGRFEDSVTYSLKETPCGEVVGKQVCCYPAGVRHRFPTVALLQQLVAESYVGVTLFDAQQHPIGLIAAVGRRPLVNRALAESVLRLAAIRAAGELQRTQAEERFHTLFDQMLDGFALHEILCDEAGKPVDYRFLEINTAFERLTGLEASKLLGRRVLEVLPDTEPFWIETYGRVALTGQPTHFEHHSRVLDRHYEVNAFSPTLGQFATIFVDITERQRAAQQLAEQLDELRRWQDVTLGREMRIIEMKQEVNELLARQGEAPRYPSVVNEGAETIWLRGDADPESTSSQSPSPLVPLGLRNRAP